MTKSGSTRKTQFAIVGVTGLAVSFATLWLTVDVLNWHPSLGYATQTVAALHTNFTLNDSWTWRDRREGTYARRVGKFYASRVGLMLPLNQILFWALHPHLGVYATNVFCIAVATFANWFINDRFVFRSRKQETP